VASSESVISAPVYDNYESSDEEFQTDELFSFVLKDIELDNSEQEPVEIFNVMKFLYFLLFIHQNHKQRNQRVFKSSSVKSIMKKKPQILLRNLSSLIFFMIQLHFGWSLHYPISHMT
jgi:hypothetical protein